MGAALIAKRKACRVSIVHAAFTRVCDLLSELGPLAHDPCEEDLPVSARQVTLDSMEEALKSGDTVLLKGRWLVEFCKSGGVLPFRQDIPEVATWPPNVIMKNVRSKTRRSVIGAVSYCWLTPEHPDPQGVQLRALCQSIQQRLETMRAIDDIALFWDYACLSRAEQTTTQREELERSLKKKNLWFEQPEVEVWIITEDSPGVFACVKSCCSELA